MMMWLIVIVAVLALFVAVYAWLVLPNLPRRDISALLPYDYAHRGLWNTNDPGEATRPENSLAAFRAAAEKGYGMELDVHLTADGHLVVHHDDSLKRLTGEDVVIGRSTLAQVRACHLPNGEPVPTFDELLETVAGRTPLIVEVKVEKNADALSKAVYERMRRYDGLWCMESFDPMAVRWFRLHAPEVIRGQLAFNAAGKGKTWKLWWRNIGIASMVQDVWARPDFIAFDFKSEKKWCLPMFLLRRMKPWFAAWTVRSQADMDALRGSYDLQIFEKFEAKRPE
ncbi:MAG: glycerophosphodiester phosphodiesterase [Clostridiales bacterium]|nr:glycerophosphodiester phosphodiesterase [Clostridiales bacterium]